jgi:hypothetical protein
LEVSFGYELLTLAPAMSVDEPIEMSPIGRSELGDAISHPTVIKFDSDRIRQ